MQINDKMTVIFFFLALGERFVWRFSGSILNLMQWITFRLLSSGLPGRVVSFYWIKEPPYYLLKMHGKYQVFRCFDLLDNIRFLLNRNWWKYFFGTFIFILTIIMTISFPKTNKPNSTTLFLCVPANLHPK